jgi:hypothetical protein
MAFAKAIRRASQVICKTGDDHATGEDAAVFTPHGQVRVGP